MKTVALGPFSGLNNRLPDYRLSVTARGQKVGDFLRNAVNVDLTPSGGLKRRRGYTSVLSGEQVHSLWSDGAQSFFVDGSKLYRLDIGETAGKTEIASGLVPGVKVSFWSAFGTSYWSNGSRLERIVGGVSAPCGVPVPSPAPVVTASTGGSLPAGRYQVVLTFRDAATGEESGATWPNEIDVPDKGVVQIAGIPTSSYEVCVYLTPVNGDQFFHVETLAPGTTTARYPLIPAMGGRCSTLGLRPMPAGQIVREHGARLLVVSGKLLCYSEPFAPHLHNPARGYIPFPVEPSVVMPVAGGVYVVADKTYWLAGGDIEKTDPAPVLPYGAVPGTEWIGPDNMVGWFSARGEVIADPTGQVKNLQEQNVAVDSAAAGATFYREVDGMRHVVSALFGTEPSKAAATSYFEAEVIRKESML